MSKIFDEPPINVKAEFQGDVEADPAFLDAAKVLWLTADLLETIQSAQEQGVPLGDTIPQEFIDELQVAHRVGQQLLNHNRLDDLKRDMTECDDDLLRDLRGSVVFVGHYFGVDVDLPAPGDTDDR